ncbi:MAG TPA: O-antigen ligase family protein [Candidatus Acidoferrum sp.]|jgi:O-antigen ligase|nr:O-antigen ligase family protein [Candidatus Acidoferrum sp.]
MLRRAIGRTAAIPLSKPDVDQQPIERPAVPANRLVRYATLMLGLTAACLPLYVIRWKYGPISTTLLEALVVLTIALYVLGRRQEGALRFHRTPYDIPILLLLVAGACAVFVPPDRWHALGLYRAYFIEPIAIFYISVDLLRRPSDVRGVLIGFGIGTSIFAALNMVAFFVSLVQGTFVLGSPPTALYTSAPEVAMYLEPPLALAAGFVMFGQERRDRVMALAWMAFLVPALTLTFSRGAYLAIAALALVAIASTRARVPLAAAIAVVVVVLLQVPLVQRKFAGQFDLGNSQTTIRGRLSIFSDTLTMLREHPIFGTGLGGYHYLFRGTVLEIYPHDDWLTFWVEVGLLGMVAFAIIFFGLLYRGWRAFPRATGFERALLWGVSGSFVLWGVHGLVDSPYWKNDMSIEFWILAALELVAIRAIGKRGFSTPAEPLAAASEKPANLI